MDDDGLFFYNLYVRKMSRRNLSFGLLLGAVAARASCYLRCGPGAPKLGLLQPHGQAVTADAVLGFRNWDCCSLTGEGRGSSILRFPLLLLLRRLQGGGIGVRA